MSGAEIDLNDVAVVDIETSGANFVESAVLSVAIVPFNRDASPLSVFVRPEAISWNARAREYFDEYADEWHKHAVPPAAACDRIADYSRRTFSKPFTVVAHNLAFDFGFLRRLFHSTGRDESAVFSHRGVDTHSLLFLLHLQGLVPQRALSSSGAFKFFGISVPEAARHTALGDAIATRALFQALVALSSRSGTRLGPIIHGATEKG